jgi:hypothetical protein
MRMLYAIGLAIAAVAFFAAGSQAESDGSHYVITVLDEDPDTVFVEVSPVFVVTSSCIEEDFCGGWSYMYLKVEPCPFEVTCSGDVYTYNWSYVAHHRLQLKLEQGVTYTFWGVWHIEKWTWDAWGGCTEYLCDYGDEFMPVTYPCDPSQADTKTWGSIKALFR